MQVKKMKSLPSRTGRHLQRYNQGLRLVVGCIPYRIRKGNKSPLLHGIGIENLEVLLITSQKSSRMMFPKGGWELDEDIELAAARETLEEAGVVGLLGKKLGEWTFKSKSQDKYHEGSMFSLLVTEELDVWPEQGLRRRIWMTIEEAREACADLWMKEALEEFVCLQFAPLPLPTRVKEEQHLMASAFVCHFSPLPRVEEPQLHLCTRLTSCRAEDFRQPGAPDEEVDYYFITSTRALLS